MRVVVDTNVLISAFFWGGVPGQVLQAAQQERCTIVSSEPLLAELLLVLQREKFAKHLRRMNRTPQQFLHNYRASVALDNYAGIAILTPSGFLEQLNKNE